MVSVQDGAESDAKNWSKCFGADARRCFVRSHLHRCMKTCFKQKGSGDPAAEVRVCRFGFNHEYHVAVYARPKPQRPCKRENCCMKGCKVVAGRLKGRAARPDLCPPPAAGAEVKKFLRSGKALVLPRAEYEVGEEELRWAGEAGARFLPRVVRDGRYGFGAGGCAPV